MDTHNSQIYFLKDLPCINNAKGACEGRQIFQKINPGSYRIRVYDSCSSSLDKSWDLIRLGEMLPGDSILCLEQCKGRGRMGRQWYSPLGNIYAAWMLPAVPPSALDGLISLMIGYCFRQAFQKMGVSLKIKWPNDLMYNGKKVGGILIEEKNKIQVAGIGLNIASCPPDSLMRQESSVEAGALHCHNMNSYKPFELWSKLVYQACFWYDDILCNFSLFDFIYEINSNLWLIGERVVVETNDQIVTGILAGIGEKGQIIIETFSGNIEVTSGTIRKEIYSRDNKLEIV